MRRVKNAIVIWLIVLGLSPLPLTVKAENPELIRLAFPNGWEALPAIVAVERGFFSQEGIVASGHTITSTEALFYSLAKGSTDFAFVPQRTFLAMAAAKLSVKVVALGSWGQQMELIRSPTDDSLITMADLKGKTIALTKGSEALPVLIRLLNRAKLPFSDTSIKFISADDMTKGFSQSNLGINAIIETKHFTSVPVTKGTAKIFLGNAEIVKSIGYIGASPLVGRQSLINDDPSLVQKTVSAWIKALHYIQQDPDDAARLLVIFFHRQGIGNISFELTKSWVNMARYDRYLWEPTDTTDAEYNGWGLREAGVLKELPKLEGYIDNRFAKKALAKLENASEKTGGRQ